MDKRRVVITGMGCVTAYGETVDSLFDNLCKGNSGVSKIEGFDPSDYDVKIAGECTNFDVSKYIERRKAKRLDRFSQFALVSSMTAFEESGLDLSIPEEAERTGVLIGSGIGGIQEIETQHKRLLAKGPSKVSAFCVPKLMVNAASGCVSIELGAKGPNLCVVTACASAAHSIGEAFRMVQDGDADVMITGGSEAAVSPIALASFCSLKSLSTRNDEPEKASRPFDVERDGFILSEGAGTVILEEYEHAVKRGAKIYAELAGYSATGDAHHITAPLPDGAGAARGMKLALNDAGVNPEDVDYINAHGTSTQLNDIAETLAIRSVFGEHADRPAISSTKSCTGHFLGASGAIELIVSARSIDDSIIPLTANTENLDEKCLPQLNHILGESVQRDVDVVLSNSLGFGGHNASLVLKKVK
ncbi:beta-ketoacyl-ACP synthase II [Sedimentisphaera salicampi]|uniref:3-oxoacyl-[acyl-carrier-protein] synthase 2 n=1 Tax=Sedimentisphaera salicampi TaxID=1941349 RepID=A0A1W6LKQ9_9BACT|nr:beta-ketoacyl-ACP synthase II [Sedimentisphaera salicampi]ARN56380.1 3-oxoacyl-[acyl-carrier-protein] synthase 2 [Sedimentisphaera salicampi]